MRKKLMTLLIAILMVVGMMPNVSQKVDAAIVYSVMIDKNIEDGKVETDKTKPAPEETVTLTVTPDVDFKLKELTVTKNKDIEALSDLISLFGDATFYTLVSLDDTEKPNSLKVVDGKFTAYDKDGTKITELNSSATLEKETAYEFFAQDGEYKWSFIAFGDYLDSVRLEYNDGQKILYYKGTNTGSLPQIPIETTTVTEGEKYTFIMPRSDVHVSAKFEKITYSIAVDPTKIEWSAEEGYKGSTDDGIEADAIHEIIKATSTGTGEVEFILAGFKDMASYELFDVFAGGMEVTVAPKEGLAAGTYNATVVIVDYKDRFEDVEVPVTFTVTSKQEDNPTYSNTAGDGQTWTKGSTDNASFTFKNDDDDSNTYEEFVSAFVDGKELTKDKDYTAKAGSVIIDLKPSFLETLSVGEHTLTARFIDDIDVNSKFNVVDKPTPKPTPSPTPSRNIPNTSAK